MKNLLTILTITLLMLMSAQDMFAQKFPDMDKSPMDMAYYPARAPFRAFEKDAAKKEAMAPVMRIIYSRPQLNERSLNELAPAGEVWRLGANESAELDVLKTVSIGGTKLEPGRYTLYAVPGDDEWTLVINSGLDGWGAYSYNQEQDVARVQGTVSEIDEAVEAFSILFADKSLDLAWGNTKVSFPVE